jgi:hypothetical protein
MSEFRVYANKGWQMVFPNGWEISVMFGAGNYCQHRWQDELFESKLCSPMDAHISKDAHVGVFKPDRSVCSDFPHSSSSGDAGYMSPDQVAEIIAWVVSQ